MRVVVQILFGAAFTVGVSLASGALLLRRLRVSFQQLEAQLFAFVAGSACLSLAACLLCVVHLASPWTFLATGAAVVARAIWEARSQPRRESPPSLGRGWLLFYLVLITPFFFSYLLHAMAPEISPDGAGYHLGNVARTLQHHGFDWDYRSMYAALPQGAEMLFLVAFAFGGHSAAAMVHFAFFTTLPLLMVSYSRRFGFPRTGLFAAAVTYASPVLAVDGTSAYNDVALATVIFAVFYLLQVWDENQDRKLLTLSGLLCGYACSIKYTAAILVLLALYWVWQRSQAHSAPLVVAVSATVAMAPWSIRNWVWLGNPFAPFLNRWFANANFHPGAELNYLGDLARVPDFKHYSDIPVQLTMRGGVVPGIIGAVFLLAPFALLAWRAPHGKRLLAAAAIFALPVLTNPDTRFLIPSLPFVALAMGLGLANTWGALPVLAAFTALACWPGVLTTYCDPWAWRLRPVPVRAAISAAAREEFLAERVPDYVFQAPLEKAVAPNEIVFSFAGRPQAYLNRKIIIGYESALGNWAQDVLGAPLWHPPVDRQRFLFRASQARGVRVVELGSANAYWSVAEMRCLSEGRELVRSPSWRFDAKPNPWGARWAFDGNLATRWSTWQAMAPGDHLELDFENTEAVDEVVVESALSQGAQMTVEVRPEKGGWARVGGTVEESREEASPDLRRAASLQLKARGIHFLLVNDSDFAADDLKKNASLWGITELFEAHGTRFYRID